MTTFNVHTIDTAPEAAKPLLEAANRQLGFVPNLLGVMAEAPAALEAYLALDGKYGQSGLSGKEREVVALAVSRVNTCHYCLAAHGTLAGMQKVPADEIARAKAGEQLSDPKLNALANLASSIAETRGRPAREAVEDFHAQGYGAANYLEVVLGVTLLTFSNYVNNRAETPVDEAFQAQAAA